MLRASPGAFAKAYICEVVHQEKGSDQMKAVIFDMDGVLIDTEPVSKKAFAFAYEKNGIPYDESVYQKLMGRSLENIKADLSAEHGEKIGAGIITDRNTFYFDYFDQHIVETKRGILDLLAYLKKHDFQIAVATSSTQPVAEKLLKQAEIYDFFDAYVFGSDVVHSKPDPEIFLLAAEKLAVEPKDAFVVEDAEAGLIAAYKGGFVPVYLPESAFTGQQELDFDYAQFDCASDFQLNMIQRYFEASL